MSIETSCAFTGHRPEKLKFASLDKNCDAYCQFRERLAETVAILAKQGIDTFISGGARGVDTWAMEAVSILKHIDPSVRMIAALPYRGHNPFRDAAARRHYEELLDRCDEIVYVSENYHRACFHQRNRWMVDRAAHLIAVYDGSQSGGTAYTVKYAEKLGRNIITIAPN